MPLHFHTQNISFSLKNKKELKRWISHTLLSEKKNLGQIDFIFCDDAFLLQYNKTYLKHNAYTDIITFDYSIKKSNPLLISGDIFISIERVKENASKFNTSFMNEIHRVMIHGVLHLIGYKDKGKKDKLAMRIKEDFYLALLD